MTSVRVAASLLLLVLIGLLAVGLVWTARHQPHAQAQASHIVLTLSGLAALVGLVVLWRPRRT